MNESKLLIAISEAWSWIGIQPRTIVGENDFGNLIIQDVEDRYWRLSPEQSSCEVIAENRASLDDLAHNQEFLADWYMSNLIAAAKAKLGELPAGRKYYFVVPPVLGGNYSVENMETLESQELIRVSGSIALQIKDLSDGTEVRLVVD